MAKRRSQTNDTESTNLVGDIAADVQKLIGQHFELLRQEMMQEVDHVKTTVVSGGLGAGLLALGGIFGAHMGVHLVQRATGLPLWASYGVMAGLLTGVGASQLARAR